MADLRQFGICELARFWPSGRVELNRIMSLYRSYADAKRAFELLQQCGCTRSLFILIWDFDLEGWRFPDEWERLPPVLAGVRISGPFPWDKITRPDDGAPP